MARKLEWTPKQTEVYRLLIQPIEFKDIIAKGFTKNMVSRVKGAIQEGQKPEGELEPGVEPGGNGSKSKGGTNQPLITVAGPARASPIVFKVGQQQIILDPLELYRQYSYYADLGKKDGLNYSFSEVLTIGMQLVWMLQQDIPLTENMLTAILSGYK